MNQLFSFFWTIVGFAPVLVFWLGNGVDGRLYWLLGATLVVLGLPGRVWDAMTLSSERRVYERLGVKLVRRFVQNGDMVREMSGEKRGRVIAGGMEVKGYLKTIAMYERFHWACFVFFLGTAGICVYDGQWLMGIFVMAANVIYNLLTIVLQQYNKMRVRRILDK